MNISMATAAATALVQFSPFNRVAIISCSGDTRRVAVPTKSRRKPRPSFHEQIREKWSLKIDSPLLKFPWQDQPKQQEEEEEEEEQLFPEAVTVKQPSFLSNRQRVLAPWVSQETEPLTDHVQDEARVSSAEPVSREHNASVNCVGEIHVVSYDDGDVMSTQEKDSVEVFDANVDYANSVLESAALAANLASAEQLDEDGAYSELLENAGAATSVELPWAITRGTNKDKRVKSSTILADKLIPDHELKRLRNVSLRMLERISVGPAGITQDLLNSIHDKWATDEVVKLKFQGPSSANMKRIHEILERRTGGLVIWRSGSSVVLYRGMTYKLPCVQAYKGQSENDADVLKLTNNDEVGVCQSVPRKSSVATADSHMSNKSNYTDNLSSVEVTDMNELNHLLDELGPRFYDWSGPEPLPVDADSLPAFVPGYRPPFRLLPYGAKHCLRNKQMTAVRRLARTMPPHFALGRNRDLQGLAQAMVKLWQANAIAKIAIKRGVLNTLNEKMAEELKRLTGGTLISRNKEYIVFYRGNDFLPQAVTKTIEERKKLTELHQDEEELVRQGASVYFKVKSCKVPLVAGTLAETVVATSHWGSQPSKEDIARMRIEAAFEKHASLVRYLEKKLMLAKSKLAQAEKALRKVQEYLKPAELPTDLEIITDEERFLFRKMGLSMKPFLLVGRRKVFDGTIQNMHLHWKFRELIKLIVKENNFALVKHIAISLEAESGGVLVSVDKTTKGYAIIIYRGKNYQRPSQMRPKNLLTRRQALARSIELQRREALKHHIMDVEEKIELLKSGLEEMKSTNEIEDSTWYTRMSSGYLSDKDEGEDEGEEAYLQVYDGGDDAKYVNSSEISDENIDAATKTNSLYVNGINDTEIISSDLWI